MAIAPSLLSTVLTNGQGVSLTECGHHGLPRGMATKKDWSLCMYWSIAHVHSHKLLAMLADRKVLEKGTPRK